MLIDVRDILKESGLCKTVELEFTAEGCGISGSDGEAVFSEPFRVKAGLTNIKGIIRVKGSVSTGYDTYCARCLKPLHIKIDSGFDEEYVQYGSLGEVTAEDAEVYEYSDKEVNVGYAVRDAVLLEIPIRHLCGGGCLSLCPLCGKDLNEGKCACAQPVGDMRLAGLGAYFDKNVSG